jgi:hypothetical protein
LEYELSALDAADEETALIEGYQLEMANEQ